MTGSARRILVICTDQQRWDSLGCYGAAEVDTPNIDHLADTGTVFERCYTTNPVCAPSRASMLTGVYPYQHGCWANGVKLPSERVTLLRNLEKAGYRTGLVGKLHLSPCAGGRSEDPEEYGFGWARWSHGPPQEAPDNAYHAWLERRFPELAEEARTTGRPGRDLRSAQPGARSYHELPAEAHYSTWVADSALEFLGGQSGDQPWLLWVNFFDPHHPFAAPDGHVEAVRARPRRPPVGSAADLDGRPAQLRELSAQSYAGAANGFQSYTDAEIAEVRSRYWAMIDLVDEQVGRILEAAEAAGPPEELLVLFVSDHGEMLGDHGLLLKGPMLYEGATRVPCIARWPGRVPVGRRERGLVSLADVAPTLAEAADVALPLARGSSLVDVAAGSAPARTAVMTEYRNSGHPYDEPVRTTMVRDDRYKLVAWHSQADPACGPTGELYDLDADPDELTDRWADPELDGVRARLLLTMASELSYPTAGWPEREARF